MSNNQASAGFELHLSAPAAYIPTHAGSDFGKVAIPTTYRDSLVVLYAGSASDKQKHQYRRRCLEASTARRYGGSVSETARRTVVVSPFADDDNSYNLADTATMTPLSPAPRGKRHDSSPLLQMTYSDADDEKEVCDTVVSSDEEASLTKEAEKKEDKQRSSTNQRYSMLGHGLQTPMPAASLLRPSASLSTVAASQGSFSSKQHRNRNRASHQNLGEACKKEGGGRRHSVIVSLGVKVSEYIKPTTMPDNRVPTMSHVSVGRSGM
ncbi:hypothetical protein SCUCBS95973_000930 [Sporothrix curviconia]|uniref:Uncharacterized protein n=1 Tax=Sporothrix curviconia TaxID=1260050 RepID=A0ABP0AUN8_9PEZI